MPQVLLVLKLFIIVINIYQSDWIGYLAMINGIF
ncbi:hypothetical protein O185_02355 [Photorhabdus temperata J3]|uniref:Uncharacterized protein n=1 Tax=Photorhabdus temperata J3 TaxID=1389415 RepID=U7R3A9_PHOTE|nr:hypothetical protein O185_02355 [Photorhabdus temperata J3]